MNELASVEPRGLAVPPSQQQIADLASAVSVDLSGNEADLCRQIVEQANVAALATVRAGVVLLDLQRRYSRKSNLSALINSNDEPGESNLSALINSNETADRGQFLRVVESIGIGQANAYRAMQMASFAARLPDDQRGRILALPKTKVLALAGAEPEVVESLLEGGKLDGHAPLSLRDLQRELALATSRAVRAETAAEAARKRDARLTSLEARDGVPDFARRARSHLMALDSTITEAIDQLSAAADSALMTPERTPEGARWQGIVAANYAMVIGAKAARIAELMRQLADQYPDEAGKEMQLRDEHLLTPVESRRYIDSHKQLIEQARKEAKNREDGLENETPGKRGRKRGSAGT